MSLLRRSKTFAKERLSKESKKPVATEPIVVDLQRNIELVYNEFSPDKLLNKIAMSSPSERVSRAATSFQRKYFSNPSHSIFEKSMKSEKEEELKEIKEYDDKKTEIIVSPPVEEKLDPDDFNKMLKINSPKYILFRPNHSEKLVGETRRMKNHPMSQIYQSKDIINVLKAQQRQRKKISFNNHYNPSVNSFSFTGKINNREKTETNSSKFKIRKVVNVSRKEEESVETTTNVNNGHRKNKSNIKP